MRQQLSAIPISCLLIGIMLVMTAMWAYDAAFEEERSKIRTEGIVGQIESDRLLVEEDSP